MKKLGLKITALTVLVLLAITAAKVFWSIDKTTPVAESNDTRQIEQQGSTVNSDALPNTQEPEVKQKVALAKPKPLKSIEQKELDPRAEKLYQRALSLKDSGAPRTDYEMIIECCSRILKEYPDSPQAEKAKKLLRDVPQSYLKQYDKELGALYSHGPKVKKSRKLRRRGRRRMPERHQEEPNIIKTN